MLEKFLLILKLQQHIFFLLENSLHGAGIVPTSSEAVTTHLINARKFPTRCGKNSYKFRN